MVVATTLSLILNFAVLAFSKEFSMWGDAYFYHHAANLLAEGKGWINPFSFNDLGVVRQAADHPPVHWAWLAIFSRLGFNSIGAHQVATILMGVACVPVFGLAGRRLGGHAVGVVSALIASVHAGLWSWNKMIQAEPSAVLSIVLLFLAAFRALEQEKRPGIDTKNMVLLGAAAGFAPLTRAELALTAGIIILVVVLGRDLTRSIKRLLIGGLAMIVVLAPWVTFNMSRFDTPVFLSNGAEVTFATSNCPETYGGTFEAYWYIGCALAYERKAKEKFGITDTTPVAIGALGADQSLLVKEIGRQGVQFVKDHKLQFVKMMLLRVGRVTGFYRPVQQMNLDYWPEGRDPYAVYLAWGTYALLLPFSIAGAYMLRSRKRHMFSLLASIGVALFVCALTFGNTRYRVSAEPALILLASLALVGSARGVARLWRAPDGGASVGV